MLIKFLSTLVITFVLFINSSVAEAPWFTGPLLAPTGHTIDQGVRILQPYLYHTRYPDHVTSNRAGLFFAVGLTKMIDLHLISHYEFLEQRGKHAHGVNDTAVTLGFQALEQKNSDGYPDLRFAVRQHFPTGRYNNLAPEKDGLDAMGLGSYQTALSANAQYLSKLPNDHYFRTRLGLTYIYANPVRLSGISSYGGSTMTRGRIKPGHAFTLDFSGEYKLTRQWTAVLESFYLYRQASNFSGVAGMQQDGQPAGVGYPTNAFFSLAPALEYNFSADFGILAAYWFSVKERNSNRFAGPVLSCMIVF
ncbi:MAG: transporter [Legionellaceae bacterium]|nr:transporter [Legionellaceae bacterium]